MSWGDVRTGGRRGLTGTLIEGSIALKHRKLAKPAATGGVLVCKTSFHGIKSKILLGMNGLRGREFMKARMACAIAAFTAVMLTMATSSEAAGTSVRARFSFDAVANCEKPAVQNYPVHVEGRVRYNAKLGAKPTEVVGGSASLRVAGRHTLQAVRDYPNNSIVVYMTV